ncbi:hypothetical protein V7149_00375 [Bacillus sp. JJ1503]
MKKLLAIALLAGIIFGGTAVSSSAATLEDNTVVAPAKADPGGGGH